MRSRLLKSGFFFIVLKKAAPISETASYFMDKIDDV